MVKFDIRVNLWKQHHNQDSEPGYCSQRFPDVFVMVPPVLLHPLPRKTLDLLLVTIDWFVLSRASY